MMRQGVEALCHIADGIDVRIAGLRIMIHPDAAAFPDLQSGLHGQCGIRLHADGHDDQIAWDAQRLPVTHRNDAVLFDRLHARAQMQLHAMVIQLLVQDLRHLFIKRRQDLIRPFDQGHILACLAGVFRGLDADEAAADDADPRNGGIIEGTADLHDIADIADDVHIASADALDAARQHWLSARGQDQPVIAFLIFLFADQAADTDGLPPAVDADHLGVGPYIDRMTGAEAFRCHHHQRITVGHDAAEMIRQTAVGKRHMRALFKHDDLRMFVQSAQSGCGRCAGSHTAYDHDLHLHSSCLLCRPSCFHYMILAHLRKASCLISADTIKKNCRNSCSCRMAYV